MGLRQLPGQDSAPGHPRHSSTCLSHRRGAPWSWEHTWGGGHTLISHGTRVQVTEGKDATMSLPPIVQCQGRQQDPKAWAGKEGVSAPERASSDGARRAAPARLPDPMIEAGTRLGSEQPNSVNPNGQQKLTPDLQDPPAACTARGYAVLWKLSPPRLWGSPLTELRGGAVALGETLWWGEASGGRGYNVGGEWRGRRGCSSACRRRAIATWKTT